MSVIKNPLLLYREDLKNPFKNVQPTVDIYSTSKYLFLKDLFIYVYECLDYVYITIWCPERPEEAVASVELELHNM